MIECMNLTKKFGNVKALENLSCTIPEGCVYGLIGSNGAGKSTLLRLITGIYRPNSGYVTIDDLKVNKMDAAKAQFTFVSDELFFLPGATMKSMARFYSEIYKNFSYEYYNQMLPLFELPPKSTISGFSKGMKRQAATVLALSCRTKYLFFDETFDGLDPIKRNLLKKIIHDDVKERNSTVVITSHSLRELEDTCSQLALLHKGGLLFESDVKNLKTSLFKVQIGLNVEFDQESFPGMDILKFNKQGSVANMIVRGDRNETLTQLNELNPVLLDVLPLTLEEVFIFEMESIGYAFADVL